MCRSSHNVSHARLGRPRVSATSSELVRRPTSSHDSQKEKLWRNASWTLVCSPTGNLSGLLRTCRSREVRRERLQTRNLAIELRQRQEHVALLNLVFLHILTLQVQTSLLDLKATITNRSNAIFHVVLGDEETFDPLAIK